MPKVTKNCEECGCEFSNFPSLIGRFCSKRCSGRWTTRVGPPRRPRRGTEKSCETCGKPVYATANERAKGLGRFCSYACQGVWQRKEPIRKQCAHCGKALELKPSQEAIQYCSRQCMGDGKTKRPLDRMHNGRAARKDEQGYVLLWEPTHPSRSYKGWIYEHRLVAEATLGRYLEPGEEVHHRNGVKDDNRPENLVVLGKSEHGAETAANNWGRLKSVEERLAEYERRFGPLDDG